jgi:hypothetical protein
MAVWILTRQMGGKVDLRPPVPGKFSPDIAGHPAEYSFKLLIYIRLFFRKRDLGAAAEGAPGKPSRKQGRYRPALPRHSRDACRWSRFFANFA